MARAREPQKTIERLENDGFDAVVGNPPYVRQESLKEDKDYLQRVFKRTYDATNDLYVYFVEREVELLRPGGLVGLIVANKWLRSGYGQRLRRYLVEVARPVSIVDFGHSPIFRDADTFPCVPIFPRRPKTVSAGDESTNEEPVVTCRFPREDYETLCNRRTQP